MRESKLVEICGVKVVIKKLPLNQKVNLAESIVRLREEKLPIFEKLALYCVIMYGVDTVDGINLIPESDYSGALSLDSVAEVVALGSEFTQKLFDVVYEFNFQSHSLKPVPTTH